MRTCDTKWRSPLSSGGIVTTMFSFQSSWPNSVWKQTTSSWSFVAQRALRRALLAPIPLNCVPCGTVRMIAASTASEPLFRTKKPRPAEWPGSNRSGAPAVLMIDRSTSARAAVAAIATSSTSNAYFFCMKSLLALPLLLLTACASTTPQYDVVVRHATLYDGSGCAGVQGDLAIQGDRISAVRKVRGHFTRELYVHGLAVAP